MSKKARHKYLLEKSIHAVISAIEVYNKPDFKYREESFSILMVNAWETLLKAKIVSDNNNELNSIYSIDKGKKKKNGEPFKKPKFKINKVGNYVTISINDCIEKINLDERLTQNIQVLEEIRNNAIHFFNKSGRLEKKIQAVGTASLRSYIHCANEWFKFDFNQYNFYLMPISFFHSYELESNSVNNKDTQQQNLLNYIASKETEYPSNTEEKHNISLELKTKFVRTNSNNSSNTTKFKYNDSNVAIPIVQDQEEVFKNKYPWNYTDDLLPKLKGRYSDFKYKDFTTLKRKLQKDDNFCGHRDLDWKKPKGPGKKFYNPTILKEFDKLFTKKK